MMQNSVAQIAKNSYICLRCLHLNLRKFIPAPSRVIGQKNTPATYVAGVCTYGRRSISPYICSEIFFLMSKYKFLSMFNALTPDERAVFKVYLAHNTRKESKFIHVYNQLYDMPEIERTQLASDLEGNFSDDIFESRQSTELQRKKNTYKALLNAFNDLMNEVRYFLLGDTEGEPEWITQLRWVHILAARGQDKESSRQLKLLYATVSQSPIKSLDACISAVTVLHKYQEYMFVHPNEFSEVEVLDTFKLITDLNTIILWRSLSDTINLANLHNTPHYLPGNTLSVTKVTELRPDTGYYKLQVLCQELYLMLKHDSIEYYRTTKEYFKQLAPDLEPTDMLRVMQVLRNFASRIQRENREDIPFDELFELHKIAHNTNLYRTPGALINGAWGNIIQVAVKARDFKWVEQFCNKNIETFPPDERKRMRALKDAMVYYEQQEYQLVLKALRKKRYPQTMDNLRCKALVMRSAFEVGNRLRLEEVIRTVTRNNDDKSHSDTEKAIVNAAKILRLMMMGKETQAKILRRMDETPLLYMREWLYEKAQNYSDRKDEVPRRRGRPPKNKVVES
jgi:hypothetical protein